MYVGSDTRMEEFRNERRKCRLKINSCVYRWFGHMERMREERMVRGITRIDMR